MIVYTKYSNERRREFCIRTDIRMDDTGKTYVCKLPAFYFPQKRCYTHSSDSYDLWFLKKQIKQKCKSRKNQPPSNDK